MRENPDEAPAPSPARWSTLVATVLVVALAVVGALLYTLVGQYKLLPLSDFGYLRIVLIVGLGLVAVIVVGRILHAITSRFRGRRHAGLILDVYRILAYTLLVLVALYALGVNGYALLAGGTFAGLVIGLASQTALSNFVAGIVLLLARPFEPGDRLTFTTWQYGLLMPSYPPRFFSDDMLIPGFTGTVHDIGLMYTELWLDQGPRVVFPNSIVIQGAVVSHESSQRWVRVKYEVPPAVDPRELLPQVRNAVAKDDWVVGKNSVKVYVNAATMASYVISVDALCAGNMEDPPRSALYLRIRDVVGSLSSPAPPTNPHGSSGNSPRPSGLPLAPATPPAAVGGGGSSNGLSLSGT
ncbi:MAG TPA: mechanosensitive ion channel family protein [Thermoplasmata archaeon]|nr:mechanosensitive ion channel family protein [Thermoplasmata archaeon]